MREIKFRAWEKNMGEMLYPPMKVIGEMMDEELEENILFMQFTGLLDKNSKEIYEGDILTNTTIKRKFDNRDGDYKYHDDVTVTKDIVTYDSHWCSFDFTKQIERGMFEVIGNIYENPELLQGDPKNA